MHVRAGDQCRLALLLRPGIPCEWGHPRARSILGIKGENKRQDPAPQESRVLGRDWQGRRHHTPTAHGSTVGEPSGSVCVQLPAERGAVWGRRRPGCCTDYSTWRVSGKCQSSLSDSNKHLGVRWVLGQSSGGGARVRAAGTYTRVWLPLAAGAQKALRKRSGGRAGGGPGKVSTEPARGHYGEGERRREGWV